MMNKKILILSVTVLLIVVGFLGYYFIENNKDIETISANVIVNNEEILSGNNGVVSEIFYKNFDEVKQGDIIAKINVIENSTCLSGSQNKDKKQSKAVEEYENAAIMYKDGVISKEEYDKSLDKYKETVKNSAECKQSEQKSIYASVDGVVIYSDEIKKGANVSSDTVIAVVTPEHASIEAYFSPKYKKKLKVGADAQITIVKYPERTYSGNIVSVDKIDMYGQSVTIDINEETSSLKIKNGDAAIVKILKK